jgi:ADP-heptose:LPS heptosyltransferase
LVTKVLIIRFSSIGDIVLTSSLMRQIKEQWIGEVEIHYLVKSKFVDLLKFNPRIHSVHSFEKSVTECYSALEQESFDYIFDLQSNLRSSLVKKRLKSLSFTLDKKNWDKFLWVKLGVKRKISHIVDRYRMTCHAFNILEDGEGLEFYGNPDEVIEVPIVPYIAVVLGATHEGKRADAKHWVNWLRKVSLPMVLLGGASEMDLAQEIQREINARNDCGKLSLSQSAYVLEKSSLVIAGDTGLMHIAAALRKDIISLWGCTRPSLGMSPWLPGKKSVMLEPHGRGERPCSKLGDYCRHGWENKCIHQIEDASIQSAIDRILG